jgi:hypothetical protein
MLIDVRRFGMGFTDGPTWLIVGHLLHFIDIPCGGCSTAENLGAPTFPARKFQLDSVSRFEASDFCPIIFWMAFLDFFERLSVDSDCKYFQSILNNYLHPVTGDARSMWL